MVSTKQKQLPEDGSIPKQAQFTCRTCQQWFASRTGHYGHLQKNPGHLIWNVAQNRQVRTHAAKSSLAAPASPNGHHALGASARDLLLDYILEKAKVDLNAELDRMFRDLKSQPVPALPDRQAGSSPQPPTSRRTYVAR